MIYKLEEITLNIVDGVHGDCEPQDDSGYYFISVKDMDGDHIQYDGARQISPSAYFEAHKRTRLESGDVLFANTGDTIGKMLLATPESVRLGRTTFQKSIALLKPNFDFVTVDYFYYVIMSNRLLLKKAAVGSGQKNLLLSDMRPFLVEIIDDKKKQDEVVRYVKAIDRKISLNNAINAELEKTAKLLYDYWFTQFDFPDADGKPYRSSGGAMEYNAQLKREIPKGWKVKPLGEQLDISRGSIITEKETEPGKVKVVAAGVTFSYYHSTANRPKNTITVSSSGANAGFLNFWQEEIYASDCITVRGENDIDTLLAYQFLKNMQAVLLRQSTGSAQPHVYPNDIAVLQMCAIPQPLKERVSNFMLTINNQIENNNRQTDELIALRDFLLPLLMNGQVTVAVAKSVAEQPAIATAEQPQAMNAAAKRAAVFKRLVLSSYILDNICDEPTAGRVKFEKLLYLSEHCAQLPLHSEFQRAAAGPYDAVALYSIEGQLSRNKWFKGKKVTGGRTVYNRLAKVDGYRKYVDTNFDIVQKGVIDKLLRLLSHADTERCEIVATLYGAWNDFLIDGVHPSDDQIVNEVLTNWNPSKVRIERNRWVAALTWMRLNDIVPVGYGVSTK